MAAAKIDGLCLIGGTQLCGTTGQWMVWVTIAIAVISAAWILWKNSREDIIRQNDILQAKLEKKEAERQTDATLEIVLGRAIHYVKKTCRYAEEGDRTARMDIPLDRLDDVHQSISQLDVMKLGVPRSEWVTDLRIALGRTKSGLGCWLSNDTNLQRAGLEDLQLARRMAQEVEKAMQERTANVD